MWLYVRTGCKFQPRLPKHRLEVVGYSVADVLAKRPVSISGGCNELAGSNLRTSEVFRSGIPMIIWIWSIFETKAVVHFCCRWFRFLDV